MFTGSFAEQPKEPSIAGKRDEDAGAGIGADDAEAGAKDAEAGAKEADDVVNACRHGALVTGLV